MITSKSRLMGIPLVTLLCMPISSLAVDQSGNSYMSTNCDTTKNIGNGYVDYRECGAPGSQLSLFANISKGGVSGSQAALLANISLEKVEGSQLSSTMNLARSVNEQLFASLNIARRVRTLQMGGINIADTVEGSQIGYVNIARRIDGHSFGLLTIAGNGLLHVDATVEETGMEYLTFASGRRFFTSYSLGYTFSEGNHPFAFGMGVGYHQDLWRLYVEGELDGRLVMDKDTRFKDFGEEGHRPGDEEWRHNTLFQAKLRLGSRVYRGLGFFGGVSYNVQFFEGNERLMGSWTERFTGTSDEAAWWPGLEVGIRLGR